MSDESQGTQCAVCGQLLAAGQSDCPACQASGKWQALIRAANFARQQFDRWAKDQLIGAGPAQSIADFDKQQRASLLAQAKEGQPLPMGTAALFASECWNCGARIDSVQQNCSGCGVPVNQAPVHHLQAWTFICHQIKAHCDDGRLPLVQAHACMNEAKSRIAALRVRLQQQRVSVAPIMAEAVDNGAGSGANSTKKTDSAGKESGMASILASLDTKVKAKLRRPLWEIILDPHSIQWFLGLGGTIFIIGLVIWLATLGIFDNPLIVAVALGIGNAAVLGGGWAMIRFSRYQTAGRAITLLASLVMPLNLWFYHSYDLITLEGHLWLAALVCCVIYLASALLLRDHLFVYVFNGGIALTGLLMLADMGRFWEIASPATLLVVLGLLSIHVERAFPEIESPFSRRRFGLAFFHSGHVLMAAGLLLVLIAQVAGDWLYQPLFKPMYQSWHLDPAVIVTERWGQFLALALVLAGSYAYFYSDIVVRRIGVYVYMAVFTLLWAEMLVIELVALHVTAEAAILALALTGLAANLLQPGWLNGKITSDGEGKPNGLGRATLSLSRAGQPLGLFLCTIPVLLGLVLHLRATYRPLNELWHLSNGEFYVVTWLYVAAMFVTAFSCRVGAHCYRHSLAWLSSTYFFGAGAATLMGLAGLLSVLGIKTWDEMAPLMMIAPIFYIIGSRIYRGHSQENPLAWVAHSATGVMIAAVIGASLHLTPQHVYPISGERLNLLLAAFFAEAAIFYALAAAFRKQGFNIYLGTASACGAICEVLYYYNFAAEDYTLIFALLGFGLLIGYRLAMLEWTGLVEAAFQCANALMSLSFVAAALITLSRLGSHPGAIHWSLVGLLVSLTVLSLLAAWLVRQEAWRRWYITMAITEAALTFITLHFLSTLSLWDKLEIFSIVVGLALLVIGHIGWHREQDQQSDLVSFSLLFGSLLMGVPLTIAVLIHRFQPTPEFSTLNELGMLIVSILLLLTGFILQLRSTTMTGASMLTIFLITLVLYINMPENVSIVSIWAIIVGAIIFGTGIFLSIYRDRLLTLPDKITRREGIFRVLSWR